MSYRGGVNWPAACVVIVPCFNEAGGVRALVEQVRVQLPRVIVVDDGSVDGTATEASAAGAEVIQFETNQGKGAALSAGCERALAEGAEWALLMDGDGQHAPADIPAFLACAVATGADLVIGNRMGSPLGMPWLRHRVNAWMSRRLSRLTGRTIPDSQCGFRLLRLETWRQAATTARCFEIESDTVYRFAALGARVEFVPIRVIYRGRPSRIRPLRDTLRWLRWWRRACREAAGRRASGSGVTVAKDSPCRAG